MRRTKIICTIGPSSEKPEIFFKMAEAGMNVVRLNLSHGSQQEHGARIDLVKQYRKETGKSMGLLLDTRGPEIRLGIMKDDVQLIEGSRYTLTTVEMVGDDERASITYKGLPKDVQKGDDILIDDGLIHLRVESVQDKDIVCTVINGGPLGSQKGVNIPGVHVKLSDISAKDKSDILFGIKNGIDFVAASFVQGAEDIFRLKDFLRSNGGNDIHVIAKIETREAVNNVDSILEVADGIMVARGDLGVEIAIEEVPIAQKAVIKKCNTAGKPVIVATQMLDSMIRNPRPTRAEANDVAGAVYDGADAIMLSGETASGKYPLEALQTMDRIAQAVEASIDYARKIMGRQPKSGTTITDAISTASCTIAISLGASAILTPTKSGYTARMVSKHRPSCPIIALPIDERTFHKLSLIWGVMPMLTLKTKDTDELLEQCMKNAIENGMVKKGDILVITAGVPLNVSGATNLIKVQRAE
ncbi:MAG: pyruvate kinase [Bacillota bacterium]|nr:pyruvate kinase [Bacillota bacterium]